MGSVSSAPVLSSPLLVLFTPSSLGLLPMRPSSIPSIISLHPIQLCTTAPPGSRDGCHRDGGTGGRARKVEVVAEEENTSANDRCC